MKQNICVGLICLGVICLLITAYFQFRSRPLPANYLAPGTGTYDQANNLNHPDNKEKLVETLAVMIFNPIPFKSMMAMDRLGRLGALSEPAIPNLEKVVEEYPDEKVKAAATQCLETIRKAIEEAK